MHLWPSFRLRDSFKWDYLKNLDRNLQRMKSDRQQRQRLNASPSSSSDPQPADSSSSLLLPSDVGDGSPQIQFDGHKVDGRPIPTTNWILVLLNELFLILSCCYCCFCCGDSFPGGTPLPPALPWNPQNGTQEASGTIYKNKLCRNQEAKFEVKHVNDTYIPMANRKDPVFYTAPQAIDAVVDLAPRGRSSKNSLTVVLFSRMVPRIKVRALRQDLILLIRSTTLSKLYACCIKRASVKTASDWRVS